MPNLESTRENLCLLDPGGSCINRKNAFCVFPRFDYCFCCGVEFGYQDCNIEGIKSFRDEWLRNGAKWDEKDEEPSNWSLEEQMKNIPEKFR